MSDQFAWLIEHADSEVSHPLYWTGDFWTSDYLKAKKFESEQEAIDYRDRKGMPAIEVNPKHRVCEHGWHDATELGER